MKDFEKIIRENVLIEKVNIARATYKEALEFKNILNEDINEKKFKKIVIDLSECEFIDSPFLGAIVFGKKSMETIGGKLEIVGPNNIFQALRERSSVFNSLGISENIEHAIIKCNLPKTGEYNTTNRYILLKHLKMILSYELYNTLKLNSLDKLREDVNVELDIIEKKLNNTK